MVYVPQSKKGSTQQNQQDSTNAITQKFSDDHASTIASLPLHTLMANSPQQQKLKATAQMMANNLRHHRLNTALKHCQGGVVQGYFDLAGQPTNDPDRFIEGLTLDQKKAEVWPQLKMAIETEWKKIENHHFTDGIVEEAKTKLLIFAFADKKITLEQVSRQMEHEVVERARIRAELIESQKPLSERASPPNVGGSLGGTPLLAGGTKHSPAVYTRTTPGLSGAEATLSEERFVSDDYTKGPSRRLRDHDESNVTTPIGTQQLWTKKQVVDTVNSWPGDESLARHLTLAVWSKLTDSVEGRKWEVKFREIDRLISHREDEGMGRYIDIYRTQSKTKLQSLDRDAYLKPARLLMRTVIANGDKHPAVQSKVNFIDTVLRGAVNDPAWLEDGPIFKLRDGFTVDASLSMILTHWRTILFFDWILAEDVMNNSTP